LIRREKYACRRFNASKKAHSGGNNKSKPVYESQKLELNPRVLFLKIHVSPAGKNDIVSVGTLRSLIINNCQAEDVQAVHCVALYNGCSCEADLIVDQSMVV